MLLDNTLEDVISSQIFQGYLTMRLILEDPESDFQDKDFNILEGQARNEIPLLIHQAMEQNELDWTYTELGHNFSMNLLETMPNAYDISKQMRIDLSNYGAFKAFIDDDRFVESEIDQSTLLSLGNPLDLNFLTPQVYMQVHFVSKEYEVWDLYTWSSMGSNAFVGSVHYSKMLTEAQEYNLLEFKISNQISKEEKMELASLISTQLPEDVQVSLQIRLYHFDEVDVLSF